MKEAKKSYVPLFVAGDAGQLVAELVLSLKAWEPGQLMAKGRRSWMDVQSGSRESEFALSLPFCSTQFLRGLNGARHTGESPVLYSAPIQMLIFLETPSDIPRLHI